jgi:hypothetical protein
LTNCDWMETQNLVISFDYSWFLAKNLAYDECWIMKFHYRNSSNFLSVSIRVVRIFTTYFNLGMPKSRDSFISLLPRFFVNSNPGIFWFRDYEGLLIPGFLIPGFFKAHKSGIFQSRDLIHTFAGFPGISRDFFQSCQIVHAWNMHSKFATKNRIDD